MHTARRRWRSPMGESRRKGRVYLVGAGPGDPELITVRGLEILRRADVVVYDRLVAPALLDEAPPWAERICVGKYPGGHSCPQDRIHTILIERAAAGLVVVRLKGGDPFVFGRGGEECEALQAAGVAFEVVPGVTSATAVPAYAGIPVTHRRYASAFAVVSGHRGMSASDPDWEALARIPTLVVLMGLLRLPEITQRLIRAGLHPLTPAAVIADGTTAHQRTVQGTLSTVAALAREAHLQPPATLVVGQVVGLRKTLEWFEGPRPWRHPLWSFQRSNRDDLSGLRLLPRLQETHRVQRGITPADLEVQVGAGDAAAGSHRSDGFALLHPLPRPDEDPGRVTVPSSQTVFVFQDDQQAVAAPAAGEPHSTVADREDGRADRGGDVDAVVVAPPAIAEARGDDPPTGPPPQ